MKEKTKEILKKVSVDQILLIVVAICYLLETLFIKGLFTNPILLIATSILGVVAIVISAIKKKYKWALIDLLICILCLGIAYPLYML